MLVRSRATSATLLPEVAARRLAGDEIGLWVELRNAVDPQLPVTREGVERGIQHEQTLAHFRLDLDGVRLPESAHPPGVEIVPLERCLDLAPQLFEIAREAAADMPSADPIEFSYDDWYRWEIRSETLRHD